MAFPTYGELLQFLEYAERNADKESQSVSELLVLRLHANYPCVNIGRPSRLLDTVRRIAAPTRPSAAEKSKLNGSSLRSYLKRRWSPRVRNMPPKDPVPFPKELLKYNLTDEILQETLSQFESGVLTWSLKDIPTVGFYKHLHPYLKKWHFSRCMTKTHIGRYYTAIDHNLKRRGGRPDNIYRFIERVVTSDEPNSKPMFYGESVKQIYCLRKELKENAGLVQDLTTKVHKQESEIHSMKMELESTRIELGETKDALSDVARKVDILNLKKNAILNSKQKLQSKCEGKYADHVHFEEELLEENSNLTQMVESLQRQVRVLTGGCISIDEDCIEFHTMDDSKQFSPAIRSLYYQLLADEVPPAKIKATIKAIIKCFFPLANVDHLRLPSEGCAAYMRRQELKTVSMVHKAITIAEQAQAGSLHLNSDGTTKFQKKIDGIALNGIVVSVNEIPDGSADSIVEDISQELAKLREIAHALNIPNADKINWTLICSSTSDSAATQKRLNRLIQEHKEEDENKFGPVCTEAIDVVENFCAMHLGVNLRKAFLDGMKTFDSSDKNTDQQREQYRTDTLVHEFCKLFGKSGVPEYGCGASAFIDFLNLMLDKCTSPEEASYYSRCLEVSLDRQVGSRYFVTASNASKILFLLQAAIDFLKFTNKHLGIKLERDLFKKLQDQDELARLKADALMFHHVYADLVMLAKSLDLSKSAFDMNKHYLELKVFLDELEQNPKTIMNRDFHVFYSESRLYGKEKVNHRVHPKYLPIQERLFQVDEWDERLLLPLISVGASTMKCKLCTYAQKQLPGGMYWEPEPKLKTVLQVLKPNNDLCESILGLNDHLTTTVPNMIQLTRSNLLEVKKNKTLQWFDQLPKAKKDMVVDMAVKRRVQVMEYNEEKEQQKKQRMAKMLREKQRREALKKRADVEIAKLSKLHIITCPDELNKALSDIDHSDISAAQKRSKKLSLLREQVNIRKKVHKQNIKIPFSKHGKTRPLREIVHELVHYIETHEENPDETVRDPFALVGKVIQQRFEVDGQPQWFDGCVVSYNAATKLHKVAYDGEEEHCHFNLMEDLVENDLRIVSTEFAN